MIKVIYKVIYKDTNLLQGENPEDWDAMEVVPRTNPAEDDEVSCNFKKQVFFQILFLGG